MASYPLRRKKADGCRRCARQQCSTVPRSEVIRIPDEEVTRLFHPSAAVLKSIRSRPYDIAIDLNLDFLLPSGYICRASNARVRVGFTRPGADLFYNFQVKGNGSNGTALYDRLAACLKMF